MGKVVTLKFCAIVLLCTESLF